MSVLGIQDPGIWIVYLLCIFCAVFCVYYGLRNWNKGDEEVSSEDIKWVKDEKGVEEKL